MQSPSTEPHRLALARRLERAEASACAAYVDARRAVQPGAGAEWIEVAGAYAMFDGVGSPLTQSFGLGIFEPFLEAELERVERFFREHGSDTFHEVCELANSRSVALLEEGGYVRVEESSVMIRPTAGECASLSGEISVRRIAPGEERHWAEVAAQGWPASRPTWPGSSGIWGSASARNAERRGFRAAYSRSKWHLARRVPA